MMKRWVSGMEEIQLSSFGATLGKLEIQEELSLCLNAFRL